MNYDTAFLMRLQRDLLKNIKPEQKLIFQILPDENGFKVEFTYDSKMVLTYSTSSNAVRCGSDRLAKTLLQEVDDQIKKSK